MKKDVFKDYLSSINTDSDRQREALREIQGLLQDSESTNQRIQYLYTLANQSAQMIEGEPPSIPDPLTQQQRKILVEKGIIVAWRDGDVTSEQICKLAHSIDGINALTECLVETPADKHASCWEVALAVPFDVGVEGQNVKVNFVIADDLDYVRATFVRFLDLYKSDISDGYLDDHLGYILGNSYDIDMIEASDGADFEEKMTEQINDNLSDYLVCFVDEDMPRMKGTDAILSVSSLIDHHIKTPEYKQPLPRVKFVSYTQKQDLDISEDIALASGADLFFKKTGLDDFYEDIVRIFEHLVLKASDLKPAPVMNIDKNILLSVIPTDQENAVKDIKQYFNFRYINEVWSSEIPNNRINNYWINPDHYDYSSIPFGIYSTGKTRKLIASIRVITSERQPYAGMIDEIIKSADYKMPEFENEPGISSDKIIIDKFYADQSYNSYNLLENLLAYTCAWAINRDKTSICWNVDKSCIPIAEEFGFVQTKELDSESADMVLDLSGKIENDKINNLLLRFLDGDVTIPERIKLRSY